MPEFGVNVEFEVFCECGAGLCGNSTGGNTSGRGCPYVSVAPCDACVEKARDEGYDTGYEKGCDEGFDKGHDEGHAEGYDEGREESNRPG